MNAEFQQEEDSCRNQAGEAEQADSVAAKIVLEGAKEGRKKESAQSARSAHDAREQFNIRRKALWGHLEDCAISHAKQTHHQEQHRHNNSKRRQAAECSQADGHHGK